MLHTIRRIRPFHVVKPASSIHSSLRYTSLLQRTFTALPNSNTIYSSVTDDIIEKYKDELVSLRGDPELIDRLESLTVKHPGIEVNTKLYQLFFPFKLDDFQLRGLSSLIAGNNVLVMTPTGSGKTIVGELAIYFALMMGLRVVYTTPLKALSNQKFQDFRKRFGGDRVGLLTGEISINKFAPVVIMTTEVLRNMIYDTEASNRDSLNNIFMVCFDEFHYMNDPDRGTVWEECLISCPPEIRILALSATVGNIHEIKDWISNIHGPTEIIQSDYRPVPLRYLYALRPGLFPYFRDPNAGPGSLNGITKKNGDLDGGSKINPSILRIEQDAVKEFARYSSGKDRKGGGGRRRESDDNEKNGKTLTKNDQMAISRNLIPSYNKIIEELRKLNKLPAIFFIFSRDGCEEAARNAGNTLRKVKLLNREEKLYIENAVDNFLKLNPLIPVNQESINLLKNGISVHHAGLITVWKGLIEELFIANKIKVLFATETLAAGVNMPARTTVITSVSKKIGKSTTTLRTSQLLQMAGRAGRRGKDTEGTVVLMRNRFDSATEPHRILVAPIDGIKSQFKASYAFVIKLLSTKTIEDCRVLIERGFGTFLAQKYARKRKNKTKAVTMTSEDGGSMKLFPILLKYSLPELKSYVKLMNRIKKEKNSLDYLISKNIDTDEEIIDIFTEYMSIGSILQLKSGDIGYFLGDMMIEENSIYFYSDDARMLSLQKEREPSNRMDSKEGEDEPKKNFLQNLFSPALSSTIPPPTYSNRILQTTEPFDVSDEAVDKSFGKKKKKGVNQSSNRIPAYGMITQSGDFLCFTKNDIQHLVSLETPLQSSLPQIEDSSVFDKLVGLIMHIQGWEKTPYKHPLQENRVHSPRPSQYFYKARYQLQDLQATNSDVYNAIQYVLSLPSHESPDDLVAQQQRQNHEIIKQEKILVQLQQEFQTHPMTVSNDTTVIQEFFDHAATIKDNKDFKIFIDTQMRVLNATRTNADNLKTVGNEEALNRAGGALEVSDAWLMFLEVIKVLEAFKAIELLPPLPEQPSSFELPPTNSTEAVSPDSPIPKVSKRLTYRSTEFGEMVGSFTTDNDLWVSLVISHPAIERLTVHEFAGLMAAIMCDSSKVITAFYQYETSKNVQEVIEQLLPAYQSLYDLQQKYELDFPILLASEIAGIVEQWSKGMTWLELCSATSLEQGDLYRILKRTVEILRSIPQAYQVSIDVVEKAKEALVSVNRFPLIETIEDELEASNVKLPPEVQRGNNTSLSEFETPINESPEELSHLELEEEELEEIDKDFVDRDEEVESDSNDDDESLLSKIGREDEITVDDFLPFKKSSSPLSKVANGGKERKGVRTSVKEVVVEESLFDFTEDDFLDEDLNEENHDVEKIIVDLNDEEGDDVKALLAGIERDMTGQQKENMEEAVKKIKKPLKMIKRRSKGKKE